MEVLENAGMEELPIEKPHLAIKHIMKRIKLEHLQQRIRDNCESGKDEQFDRRDFGAFIQEHGKQAQRMYEEGPVHFCEYRNRNHSATNDDKEGDKKDHTNRGAGRSRNRNGGNKHLRDFNGVNNEVIPGRTPKLKGGKDKLLPVSQSVLRGCGLAPMDGLLSEH